MRYRRRVYIALFLVITHCSSLSIMVWLFHTNRQYIANTYCIYKNEKSNTCRGLCYLSEKLDLLTDQNGKKEINFHLVKDNYLAFKILNFSPFPFFKELFPEARLATHYELLLSVKIFQPPKGIASFCPFSVLNNFR